MKLRKILLSKQRLAIISSSIVLVGGFLLISNYYFTYLEVRNLTDKCYDNGGLPKVEKSGFEIIYFACDKS